jgi:hypothetical protein
MCERPRNWSNCGKQSGAGEEAARATGYTEGYHETEAVHEWRHAGGAWLDLKGANRF